MTFNRPDPSKDLRDFVYTEVEALEMSADIYWHEHESAVIVTDSILIEVYPDPDGETDYVADRIQLRRG